MSYTKRRLRVSTNHYLHAEETSASVALVDTDADAARLAACWNACLGFDDPEADIRALREALTAVNRHLVDTFPPYPEGKGPFAQARAALARWKEEA